MKRKLSFFLFAALMGWFTRDGLRAQTLLASPTNIANGAGGTCGALGGDVTGTCAANTAVKVNGASIPASAPLLGTNSSNQIILATPFATNAQSGTYQVLAADFASYKTIVVPSGTFTVTLVASGSQPATGQSIRVINYGSGVVTIARSGQNINGGTASLTVGAGSATAPTDAFIVSNGTDYFAEISSAGASPAGSPCAIQTYDTSTTFAGDATNFCFIEPLATPDAPMVSTMQTGMSAWAFAVTANTQAGETDIGAWGEIMDGPATLGGGNSIEITLPAVPGAISCNVWIVEAPDNSWVGNVDTEIDCGSMQSYDFVGSGEIPPSTNHSGGVISTLGFASISAHDLLVPFVSVADQVTQYVCAKYPSGTLKTSQQFDADDTCADARIGPNFTALNAQVGGLLGAPNGVTLNILGHGDGSHSTLNVKSYAGYGINSEMVGGRGPLGLTSTMIDNGVDSYAISMGTTVLSGAHSEAWGIQDAGATVYGGSLGTYYSMKVASLAAAATNPYSFWSDEQGVFRIRADNTFNSVYQAIPALYNPQFTKYTPGAANFERIILGQFASNRAQIGTEAGGTGVKRSLDLIAANLSVVSTLTPAVSNTTANSCGTTAATIVGNDNAFKVVVGATAGTSCTVTFATAFTNAPSCSVTNETTANLSRSTSTNSTTILAGTFVAGDTLSGICLGR